jgi:hypothetical protein
MVPGRRDQPNRIKNPDETTTLLITYLFHLITTRMVRKTKAAGERRRASTARLRTVMGAKSDKESSSR